MFRGICSLPMYRALALVALAASLALICDTALACPTCKDQLAHDPAAANIARGYAASIIFMLSVPPLILTGLGSYFYWEVRKARAALKSGLVREPVADVTAPLTRQFGCG